MKYGLYRSPSGPEILLGVLLLLSSHAAWATLGDNATSVLADQSRIKGSVLRSVDRQAYVVHEIATTSGSKIREYVSPGGAVFGVAWDGQFQPNLQELLGPYYTQAKQAQAAAVSQAASAQTPPTRRAPIKIETPGLVFYQGGHVRNFHGVAYIPQLVPSGVQASDIR
jgi:hypothetical protein